MRRRGSRNTGTRKGSGVSDVVERAKEALAPADCTHCDLQPCGWAEYERLEQIAAVAPELVAEVERLRAEQRRALDEGDWG